MANKKITELPLITALSGSNNGGTVIPVVVGGTTAQISAENFSRFVNAYNAHTGSAGNTFAGPQTINSTLSVSGNTTIGGTLIVAGRLTAEEFYTEITTASVIYSSGSTKFGDDTSDRHEFTGSIYAKDSIIIGTEVLGNAGLNAFTASAGSQLSRVYQTTASIQAQTASLLAFTASQDGRNFTLSQVTGSFRGEIGGLEAYSASLKAAAIVSSSTQIQNYDLFALNSNLYIATGSIKGEVAGIEAYTASLKGQAIVSSSTQIQNYDLFALNSNLYTATGSLIGITNGLMAYTSSNETWKTGVRAEINGIEAWTASLDNTYATDAQLYQLYQATRSLELLSGSMIGITNGLMAFTAALDSTYATDAQLYQLYQATRSIELHSGSMVGITNGLMAYTSSNETWKDGVRGEVSGIESYTSSLKSAAIVSSSTQIQNYDVFALNSNLYTSTGSIKGELAGIEAYTASLKSAISVSGTNVQIIGDLNVNKLNVQYVSSSVLVTSGSNKFGDQSNDKHEFTGSVNINGPINVYGTGSFGITNAKLELGSVSSGVHPFIKTTAATYLRFNTGDADRVLIHDGGLLVGDNLSLSGYEYGFTLNTLGTAKSYTNSFGVGNDYGGYITTGYSTGTPNDLMVTGNDNLILYAGGLVSAKEVVRITSGSNLLVTGSIFVSGSIIPNVKAGSFTSSFSLGSSTNAWGDIWVGNGSVKFVNPSSGATASIALDANNQLSLENSSFTKGLKVTGSLIVTGSLNVGGTDVTHYIGESYGGGIVFYVYDGGKHGLIAATSDQSTGTTWYNGGYAAANAPFDGINAGIRNTTSITTVYQTGSYAAEICAFYNGGNFGDWYLPSKYELNLLYQQKTIVGGFANETYWSSTELHPNNARASTQTFTNGVQNNHDKSSTFYVRAIRAF